MTSSVDLNEPRIFPEYAEPKRSVARSLCRGFLKRCPSCGEGRIYERFLKVAPACAHCGEELFHHRADDAPPYFTIFIVGHIVVPLMLMVELALLPPIWVHVAIWPTLTLALSLTLLPMVKGAVVGMQWAMRMHGFGGEVSAL